MERKIQLDLDWLAEQGLTPDEYIYMLSKHKKWTFSGKLRGKPNLKKLEERGLIKNTGTEVFIRQEFIDLVDGNFGQMFAELCATYPMKVGSPGNYRILHAADPSAKANEKARTRYRKFVGTDLNKHKKVIQGLNVMLTHSKGKLKFLQALEVWINAHGWEKWESIEEVNDNDGRVNRVF